MSIIAKFTDNFQINNDFYLIIPPYSQLYSSPTQSQYNKFTNYNPINTL